MVAYCRSSWNDHVSSCPPVELESSSSELGLYSISCRRPPTASIRFTASPILLLDGTMIRLWRLQRRLFSSGKAELPTPRARPARPAPTREEIDAVAKAKRDRLAPAPSLPAKPRTHEPAGWRENLQSAFRRTPKRRRNWQQIFHDEALPLALVTAGIACVTLVVYTNFYRLVLPYGVSMLPTIYLDGECVLVNLRHRRGRGIQVGDIVSAAHPIKLGEGVMKRVIGMPGDFVLSGTPGESSTMVQVSTRDSPRSAIAAADHDAAGTGGPLLPRGRQHTLFARLEALRADPVGAGGRQGHTYSLALISIWAAAQSHVASRRSRRCITTNRDLRT